MDENFNSSDIEFEAATNKAAVRRGQASIAKIIEQASRNRISSKKTVKQLQFGHGAPGTEVTQQRWTQRFDAFRISTLKQSIETPFTADDVLRFFDSIIDIVKPGCKGNPAPSKSIVTNGLGVIASYGTFKYPKSSGFELTAHDATRLQTWLDDAVKAGRLTKGRWHKRVWLAFTIVSRMVKAWLEHHYNNGTWSWDVTIAKVMSIVLITSLGSRVGNVARSRLYTAFQYMQYKHIELTVIGDGEPLFENLKARIVVEFPKGEKDVMNSDEEFFLSPLEDTHRHMCPITWVLIHALRHGLVRGSTIQEVLQHAIDAADSKVVWLFPDRPVQAAFTSKSTREIDLDKVAGTDQALQAIKQMDVVSNILS